MTPSAALGPGRPAAAMTWVTELRRHAPLRYWACAAVSGVVIYLALKITPWTQFRSLNNEEAMAFADLLVRMLTVVLALVPFVAIRSAAWATVLCLLPLGLSAVSEGEWPFSLLLALVAATTVATWRSPRQALVPAGVALLLVVSLVTSVSALVMPGGALIEIGRHGEGGFEERGIPFVGYAVAIGLAYVAGLWMRSSARSAVRLAGLDARAVEVEREAEVVGERARLARDLHDVVAHHVSLIAVRAETAAYTHPDLSDEARTVLADIAVDARSALEELRGVLGILRRSDEGPDRSPQPSLTDIPGLVESARAAGERVTLRHDLGTQAPAATGYVAFRVVQEALTNARRHAPGLPVDVAVETGAGRLRVRVTSPYVAGSHDHGRDDDGREHDGPGRGLTGMRERVEGLGGHLVAGVSGDLFVVEADLPGEREGEDG